MLRHDLGTAISAQQLVMVYWRRREGGRIGEEEKARKIRREGEGKRRTNMAEVCDAK